MAVAIERAHESADLVILALYLFLPPSRGLEIRTLTIKRDWRNFQLSNYKGINVILIAESTDVLHFDNYKMQRNYGHQEVTLKVCNVLAMEDFRGVFITERGSYFLFSSRCTKNKTLPSEIKQTLQLTCSLLFFQGCLLCTGYFLRHKNLRGVVDCQNELFTRREQSKF